MLKEAAARPGLRALCTRRQPGTARATYQGPTATCRSPAALAAQRVDARGTTYDGTKLRLYVSGAQVATRAADRRDRASTGAAAVRRQQRLGRVVLRAAGRAARLQPRADRRRGRGRHDPAGRAGPAAAARGRAGVTRVLAARRAARSPPRRRSRWRTTAAARCRSRPATTRAWLSVSPALRRRAAVAHRHVDTTGLAPGTYTATVTVAAPGVARGARGGAGDADGDSAGAARVGGAPASLAFTGDGGGSAPAGKTIDVTNAGGGTADVHGGRRRAVAERQPGVGQRAADADRHRLPAGLAAGTYTGAVTVSAAGASGSPRRSR